MRPLFAAILTFLAVLAGAQSVRPMPPGNAFTRATYRQAEKEGRDWPDLASGEDGTVVHITGGGDDADMTVASSASMERILAAVRKIAVEVGMPETDYLTRQTASGGSVDAEFNKYLRREGRDTRFSFPLKRLVAGLEASKLPKPLRFAIEKEGQEATLVGPKGRLELSKDRTLFSPEELAAYDTLDIGFHLEWWAPLAAGVFMLFFGGIFALAPTIMIRALRKKPSVGPPVMPTPEQIQAAYDAQANVPRWRKLLITSPTLVLFPFILLLSNKTIMRQAFAALPRWFREGMASPWLLVGILALMLPLVVLNGRRARKARQGTPDTPNPLAGMGPLFVGMAFMMVLFVAVQIKPDLLRSVPAEYRSLLIFSVPALAGGLSVFLMWRNARGASRPLPADDSVSEMARELGAQAGVRVRRVVERKHGGPNAFATLFGTVGVTSKLRETLDEKEIRAVVAHEIGHLKASDPWRFLALSLTLLVPLLGLSWWITMKTPWGDSPAYRFADQMFFFFGVPFVTAWLFSPRRRKAEHAADLFALEQTDDLELVCRALVKIHDANRSPHRLHPRDERVASHPALERRLARLREAAARGEG